MAGIDELDAEIVGELTTVVAAVLAAITALEAKATPDTQPEIDKIKSLAARLQAAITPA